MNKCPNCGEMADKTDGKCAKCGKDWPAQMSSDFVTRDAMLFEAGDYPDKGVNVSVDDLHTITRNTGRVPIQVGHTEPDIRLGEAHSLRVEGRQLFGKLDLSKHADALLSSLGMKTLSVGMPSSKSCLTEVSVTGTPRVAGARMFNGEKSIVFSLGETAPASTERTDMEKEKDEQTSARFTALQTDLETERKERQALARKLRENEAKQKVAALGQVPPAAVGFAIALLASEQPITFSENGTEGEKPVAVLFASFLDNLPKDPKTGQVKYFSAPITGDVPNDKTEEVTETPAQKLEALTQEYMTTHKVGYSVAFKSVCAANKELAAEVRTFSREGGK